MIRSSSPEMWGDDVKESVRAACEGRPLPKPKKRKYVPGPWGTEIVERIKKTVNEIVAGKQS